MVTARNIQEQHSERTLISPTIAIMEHTESLSALDEQLVGCLLDVRFVVNGELDTDKLLAGLCDLIEKKWPVVGAKLCSGVAGPSSHSLAYPTTFSYDDQPPVLFDVFDASSNTPLSSCFQGLPSHIDEDEPTSFIGHLDFTPEAHSRLTLRQPSSKRGTACASARFGPERRTHIDLINQGGPLITTSVFNFPHDAKSVVRVIFPHAIFDSTSMASFLRGWSMSVAGRLDGVPAVLPLTSLPDDMRSSSKATTAPGLYRVGLVQKLILATTAFWRHIVCGVLLRWRIPRPQRRAHVYLPQAFLDKLRADAMQQQPDGGATFVSDGDLSTAWLTIQMARRRRSWLDGFVSLNFQANSRMILPNLSKRLGIEQNVTDGTRTSKTQALARASLVFLHNGALNVGFCTTTWRSVSRMSVSQLAWQTRRRVEMLSHTDTEQILLATWSAMDAAARRQEILIPFAPHAEYVVSSNWLQADVLGAIDFSTAATSTTASSNLGRATEVFIPPLEDALPSMSGLQYMDITARRPGYGGVFICTDQDERAIRGRLFGNWHNLQERR